jgi:hypothetical protein
MKTWIMLISRKKLSLFLFSFFLIHNCIIAQKTLEKSTGAKIIEIGLNFHKPDNYFYISPLSGYFEIHPDVGQNYTDITLANKYNKIIIAISIMPYPKPIGKNNKWLIANLDLNHFSEKQIVKEIDNGMSKVKYLDSTTLNKIKADRGVVYNVKIKKKPYLGLYSGCKRMLIYKDNVAKIDLLFFYGEKEESIIDKEIEKTWRMLQFSK